MSGRNGKGIGEIVETAIGGIIAGEERLHVDVEREEVAIDTVPRTGDASAPIGPDWGELQSDHSRFSRVRAMRLYVAASARGILGGGMELAAQLSDDLPL